MNYWGIKESLAIKNVAVLFSSINRLSAALKIDGKSGAGRHEYFFANTRRIVNAANLLSVARTIFENVKHKSMNYSISVDRGERE